MNTKKRIILVGAAVLAAALCVTAYASLSGSSQNNVFAKRDDLIVFSNDPDHYGTQTDSTVRVEVPAELAGQVVSATTQDIIHGAANANASVSRTLIDYTAEDKVEYTFENGQFISLGNCTDSYKARMISTDPQYAEPQEVAGLLEDLVPDLSEFIFRDQCRAEYGYVFTYLKNGGTVCEDKLIIRLGFDGVLISVNVIRSGIDDPAEVDTDHFEAEVAAFLAKKPDTVEKYSILYRKYSGVICAFCTATFRDAADAFYCETYMLL